MDWSIPKENMAILSTGHIGQTEVRDIADAISDGIINGMSRAEGFLIYTDNQPNANFPLLAYTLGYLKAHNFHWALFDRDGERLQEIPYYE